MIKLNADIRAEIEDKGGSGWDAVAAYNAGSARMKDGQYVNQGYVDKVRKRYDELKG